jgi:hypothetical protein
MPEGGAPRVDPRVLEIGAALMRTETELVLKSRRSTGETARTRVQVRVSDVMLPRAICVVRARQGVE